MSITKNAPNLVLLAGEKQAVIVNEYAAGVALTPGMLAELYSDSGTLKARPHASAAETTSNCIALNQSWQNKGINDAYAVGDLVALAYLQVGAVIYAIIPSGQNIAIGAYLQSNGDGKLKAATATTADANLARFQALEASGAVTADTRIRVQIIN